MPSLPVFDLEKKKVGAIEVSDAVFAAEVKPHLLNDAVRYQISKRFEWKTSNSKTRTEVNGTRKKVYRQKGTGQARHGDAKAPLFVGGGKAHGPKPHLATKGMNRKALRAALISALSQNQKQDRLFVIDALSLEKASTKRAASCLKAFSAQRALFVNCDSTDAEKKFSLSVRNLPTAKCIAPEGLNVFDVLKYRNIFFSRAAIEKVAERLSHV